MRETQLAKPSLRESVRDLLLERIVGGTYRPGDRIVESRVARDLGVSQAPVREALRELATIGLVKSLPNRGMAVQRIDEEDIRAMFTVRAAIEEVGAGQAATRAASDTDVLYAEIDAMKEAQANGDIVAHASHSAAFHRHVVRASGNELLLLIWDTLSFHARTVMTHVRNDIDMAANAESHRCIADAISAGNPDEAAALMRNHVLSYRELRHDCVAPAAPDAD
jgi:DNA-binding GntR family transcriptional regulator